MESRTFFVRSHENEITQQHFLCFVSSKYLFDAKVQQRNKKQHADTPEEGNHQRNTSLRLRSLKPTTSLHFNNERRTSAFNSSEVIYFTEQKTLH